MDKFEAKLEECRKLLFDEPVVQEYFRLKKIVDADEELHKLDKEIHQHQKRMCVHKNEPDIYESEKHLYETKLAQFQENPLVQNFEQVREEVFSLLNEIKEVLE